MKKKIRFLLPSILFFIGLPIIYLLCFRTVPLQIGPETTFITAPLTTDGLCIDYFQAIKDRFEPNTKVEENGFRAIAVALGPKPWFEHPAWAWNTLAETLQFDPTVQPTCQFESANEYLKREYLFYLENHPPIEIDGLTGTDSSEQTDTQKLHHYLLTHPWSLEQFSFMEKWVTQNDSFLNLLVESGRRSSFFFPWLRKPGTEGTIALPDFNPTILLGLPELFSDALLYRANLRRHQSDWNPAWRDALAAYRIPALWSPVHFTGCPAARKVLQEIMAQEQISPERRAEMKREFDRLPKPASATDQILHARLLALWQLANGCPEQLTEPIPGLDWNEIFRYTNNLYDDLDRYFRNKKSGDRFDPNSFNELFKTVLEPPRRSLPAQWLNKPITVRERSREFAWYCNSPTVFQLLKSLINEETGKK